MINLETVSSGEKILSEEYIKTNLKKDDTNLFLDTLTTENENTEKVIPEASKAYKLYQGVLNANEEITFDLRLWLDSETPAIESVMDANYEGKIIVTSSYKAPSLNENMMIAMEIIQDNPCPPSFGCEMSYTNKTYTQNDKYKYKLMKVVYQNIINPYSDAVEIVDFSVDKDGSVMGYYVKDTETEDYILYIQANGKIKINPIASYYGTVVFEDADLDAKNDRKSLIEGIENIDTSNVKSMKYMFFQSDLEELNLNSFNTTNVTDMSYMFSDMRSLTSLNLSGWDTRNVTTMSGMFYGLDLTSLDLSQLDTSNVADMSDMFHYMSSLTSLDLSSFNTSNVTDMRYMFSDMRSLTSLNLSGWDTRNVTTMSDMFYYMSSLTSLDLSSFNTSNVTDMRRMFYYCSKLTTTINITNPNVENYENMFYEAATSDGAQITVNYTAETSDLVDQMIATKSENSNVVKGNLIS